MTKTSKKNIIVFFGFLMLLLASFQPTFAAADDIAIITGVDSIILALDIDEIRSIFLKEKKIFIQDIKIEAVNLSKETHLRQAFDKFFLGRTERELKAHWAKMVFIGAGNPPMELPDEDSVKGYLNAHSNTVGYIKRSNVDETVKVLYFITPADQ